MTRAIFSCFALTGALLGSPHAAAAAFDGPRPNVLLVTVDDMNCDSVGIYGCPLPGTTPNMDRLAAESMRFEYAHVQVANCMPSRNCLFSGRYPHNNGVEGFYKVRSIDYPVAADLMKEGGYFTGIRGKIGHSTPYQPYPGWDLVMNDVEDGANAAANRKNIESYRVSTEQGIRAARQAGKPFFLNINISDPHKPFYAEGRNGQTVPDPNVPSRVFTAEEVPVPSFLPDDPVVRKELAHYYSSVRRADDCLRVILEALDQSGEAGRTLVMFLSDHGMPLPFAKTQLYHHSTRTPWMVRWPDVTKPGAVDTRHMISAVDFLPTLLDVAAVSHPKRLDGRSFLPLLIGESQSGRDHVIKEYNENAGGNRSPMRAIQTKEYLYIFNPWSDGSRVMATATRGTSTFRRMKELGESDPAIAARLDLFEHRVPEELYQVASDPDCLKNLVDDPSAQSELARLRATLEAWMKKTGDPMHSAFVERNAPEARAAYMRQVIEEAEERGARRPARRAR